MRAAVYAVVWASILVALVLGGAAGEHPPTIALLLTVALSITLIDLATYPNGNTDD